MGLNCYLGLIQILHIRFSINRACFSIDWALHKLNNNFLQLLDSKLTLNQTLSRSKPRLNVLIVVCQHIQNEILIHLFLKSQNLTIYSKSKRINKHGKYLRNLVMKLKQRFIIFWVKLHIHLCEHANTHLTKRVHIHTKAQV